MITSFFKKSPTKRKASTSTASNKRARGRHGARATGGKEPENDEKVAEEVEDDAGADMGDESKVVTVTVGGVDISINETWEKVLRKEFKKPYFQALQKFVAKERKKVTVFPPPEQVYSAFNWTPRTQVKVVILGQDPYHGPGQAHGLCFSVQKGVRIPPSLRNMIKEAQADVGIKAATHGSLESWAKQGVFLLNNVLTVQKSKAASHKKQGWEQFTTAVVRELNKLDNVVFMLWGKPAQTKGKMLDRSRHLVLESPHPSPLSAHRGFFGCKHFSKANAYLKKHGQEPVDWNIV